MKGHVNASGFPLQMAVSNAVNESSEHHGWRTRYTEHSWKNANGESGFIDLVLADQHGTQFMVLECKRVKDTSWIFLVEGSTKKLRRHAKSFVFSKNGESVKRFEWVDLTLEPSTPESQYCVIPGASGKSQSLIERAAAELVASTEGLASEDKALSLGERSSLGIYFNVIVTTAPLYVCRVDPGSISLKDGTLDEAEFEEVPFVRFRKQLSPAYELPANYAATGYFDVARAKESTVFVVNSLHLVDFLTNFELDDGHSNERYFR
jgi:hypothetical protein